MYVPIVFLVPYEASGEVHPQDGQNSDPDDPQRPIFEGWADPSKNGVWRLIWRTGLAILGVDLPGGLTGKQENYRNIRSSLEQP